MAKKATEKSAPSGKPTLAQIISAGRGQLQAPPERAEAKQPLLESRIDGVLRKQSATPPQIHRAMPEAVPDMSGAVAQLERRIDILEKTFGDIVTRHENSLHERAGTLASVDESVLGLRRRLEDSEQRHADVMAGLKRALTDMHVRMNGIEAASAAPPAQPQTAVVYQEAAPAPEMPQFDFVMPDFDFIEQTPLLMHESEALEDAVTDGNETKNESVPIATMAAQSYQDDAKSLSIGAERIERPRSRTRFMTFACLAPLTIVAITVFVLNRHTVTAETIQVAAIPVPPVSQPSPPPQMLSGQPIDPTPAQTAASGPFDQLIDAAKAGDAKAERDVGLKYLAGDGVTMDETEAARWLMRAADQGEPGAQYWLGTLYARGHGVPADVVQANHWYEVAAKQGNRRAMHSLAVAHLEGWGVEKDAAEAARWFKSAAALGLVDSAFNLAVLYERGTGVQQNMTEAYKWYAIAASQGDAEAQARVADLAKRLPPADLALAQQAVTNFKPVPLDATANSVAPTQSSGG